MTDLFVIPVFSRARARVCITEKRELNKYWESVSREKFKLTNRVVMVGDNPYFSSTSPFQRQQRDPLAPPFFVHGPADLDSGPFQLLVELIALAGPLLVVFRPFAVVFPQLVGFRPVAGSVRSQRSSSQRKMTFCSARYLRLASRTVLGGSRDPRSR